MKCTICQGEPIVQKTGPVDEHGMCTVSWNCAACGAPQGSYTTSAEVRALGSTGPVVAGFLRAVAAALPAQENGWDRSGLEAQVELVRATYGDRPADLLDQFLNTFPNAVFQAEMRTARMTSPDGPTERHAR